MGWKDLFGAGESNIPWKNLTEEKQIAEIVELSHEKPQLIFKHSTRCSISSMAKSRLERDWDLENVEPWYLDLIAYRNVSNAVASEFGVHHESPQVVLLINGDATFHASHNSISIAELSKQLA
jgi:bacillithiol system protein YtxJ